MRVIRADNQTAMGACTDILTTLPGWFGQQEANDAYARDISDKLVFVAGSKAKHYGLIALDFHFSTTVEIWLLAVRIGSHRKGIGKTLTNTALEEAKMRGCSYAMVSTLSDRSSDPGYAATRAFYTAMKFRPVLEFNRDDHLNPMMWMQRDL